MRLNAPSLGAQAFLQPGDWQAGVGFRWQRSDRHFTGDHEDINRETEHSQVINDIYSMDLAVTYAVSKRFNLTLGIPFQLAERSQVVRSNDTQRTILQRFSTHGDGLGDIRLLGAAWLFNPEKNQHGNVSLGLGVKFPTGENDARDTFRVFDQTTQTIVNVRRTIDQSIQPGDGGWGAILDLFAFKEIFKNTTIYAAGTYIVNPEGTSGVPTYRSNPHEKVMSIADQYLGRIGLSYALLPKQGLSVSLAGRIEGVPVHDLIGSSQGFRRPGYAISIEPGVVWSKKGYTLSVSAPVALYRNRERSVPDIETSPTAHGDAAFADFVILAGFSRRF